MEKIYDTDLTDDQWALIEPLIPPAKHGGHPRTINMRLLVNTIFYLNKTGCQWRMLPKDLAQRSSTNAYFTAWQRDGTWQAILDTLRRQVRREAGREEQPQKAAIDSQTVKGSESGGARGYDGGQQINGRKRHIIVDSMGLLLVVLVTGANADDGSTAPQVLAKLTAEHCRRLDEIRGDSKYRNHKLDAYLATSQAPYKVSIVDRPAGVKGLVHLPYRWVVERTNAWNGKYRRNSKDYERHTTSSEAMIQVANIHLMLNRLRPDPQKRHSKFLYERKPMKKAQ